MLGLDDGDKLVLTAARQEYQKGLDVLLDAWPEIGSRLPSARLLMCGREGGQSPTLKRKAAALGPRVNVVGARSDVADLMCAADVFVLPSRWEGLGGVLIEAMALGAPIVASDLPSVREALDDGRCGRLVPPRQAGDLAEAVLASVHQQKETQRMAERGRERFLTHYTAERVAMEMLGFYERALAAAGSHRSRRLAVG